MAARRTERLVNLVICLLSTRQFLSAERIRAAVPGYEAADGSTATDEAFKRMFERDKAELRDLGIPLETGRNSGFDTEDGYRITRREYELPPVEFDPAEAAAVGLAARLWQSATLGEPARSALVKLRAAGTDVRAADTPGALPTIDASDPHLPTLLTAARTARPVRFDYLKARAERASTRTVEPWGVLSWRGRWYLCGYDREREQPRCFRLERVIGKVTLTGQPGEFERPQDVNLLDMVSGREPDSEQLATVRITGPAATRLRQVAQSDSDGVVTVSFTDLSWIARLVASCGTSAVALHPPALVDAVRATLRSAAETASDPRTGALAAATDG